MDQYSYAKYFKYDILLKINCDDFRNTKYEEKKTLVFVNNWNGDFSCLNNVREKNPYIHIIIMEKIKSSSNVLVFTISRQFALSYIEYMTDFFPGIIMSELDKYDLIELAGNNLYNIYHIMQICYYNQITITKIKQENYQFLNYDNFYERNIIIKFILGLKPIGISEKLVQLLLDNKLPTTYLENEHVFFNNEYIIPNIYLHLRYKDVYEINFLQIWKIFYDYIIDLTDDNDQTILEQTDFLLDKTLKAKIYNIEELDLVIFEIVKKLHILYRFSSSDKLLRFENKCKEYLKNNEEFFICILVNEAIIYEDNENYDVSREKFKQALELCPKNNQKLNIFINDEYSRLLQKMGQPEKALNILYFVESYYKKNNDKINLQNVCNRIGLNLCEIGMIKKGISHLEKLFYGDFNGKIDKNTLLSCEVANNLSFSYAEFGYFENALNLQDELYQVYLTETHTPINYATDVLQNKGCVYLFYHEYKDALICFEQAFHDEKNPVSKELILENLIYSSAFFLHQWDDAIVFFEGQIEKEVNDKETYKMLAELYFEGGYFNKCYEFCQKILKEMTYEHNQILFFSLDVLLLKSSVMLRNVRLIDRAKGLLRLYKYKKDIQKNISTHSPYYKEVLYCRDMLMKKSR